MIKKNLIRLMEDSKKYIVHNVLWQWLALWTSIVIMRLAGQLLEESLGGRLTGEHTAAAAGVVLLAVLARTVCTRNAARASDLAGSSVKQRLRKRLYEKLMALGGAYHEKVPTAEAVQVAVEGVEQLEIYFGRYLPQLFYSLLAPLTLFAVLSFISFKASLILLICVPLIPMTIIVVQKVAKKLLSKYWGIYTGLGDNFLENLQGLTTLKIYQADEAKAGKMDEEAEHFRKITMKVLTMQLNSIIVMDIVAYGGAAAGMIVAVREYLMGNIGLGGVMTIILLSSEFFIPMRLLGSLFHVAMNGVAASDKLFGILELPAEEQGEKSLGNGPVEIVMDAVEFSYVPERKVLDQVSLKLPGRGMVSLAGLSGCGKSTVASLLMGKNRKYSGEIRFNGLELKDISEESLMSHVTLVSHDSYIFKGTVEDNLRLSAPEADNDRLEEVLKEVKLYDFLMEQKGLRTELKERGANLSGGQRQRLAMARALLHDTPVYIFDEATSNIDAESENQIMEVIKKLAGRRSVLLISHRLANVAESEKIYVLEEGRMEEKGTHEELLKGKGLYAGLYSGQKALEEYASGTAFGQESPDHLKTERIKGDKKTGKKPVEKEDKKAGKKPVEKGGVLYA